MSCTLSLLGIDCGFASFGYAVLDLDGPAPRVAEFGVFRTAKDSRKGKILATEDNLRRAQELAESLGGLVTTRTLAVCAEGMSFPRSSSVAAKMAMAWGIVAAFSQAVHVPVLQASPQEIKRRLCGTKTASKDDVQRRLSALYPETVNFREALPRGQWEHAYDALAAAHVMLEAPEVVMALKAWRGAA